MKHLVIYIHGKGGSAEEAKHYQPPFPESDVIGFDYQSEKPWDAKDEFSAFYDLRSEGYDSVILIANSIGAFFSMYALAEKNISQSMFISPIVNMEKLISDMMMWSNVTEAGNVKKCAVGKHPKSEKLGSAGQAACCACTHSRYFTGGSPSGLRV